jgi:hypothetical protein
MMMWVSVKAKLPLRNGCYLVYAPVSFPRNTQCVVAEFCTDDNTFYSESDEWPMKDVTHWMCLPCAPMKEGDQK